jgi:competence protein ComEA
MKFIKALLFSLFFSCVALAAEPVDINRADAATLAASLNGIGPAKAEAIVAYREEHGPFKSVEQLAEVKGVGLKTVEKNREYIRLGGAAPTRNVAAPTEAKPQQ